MKKTNSMEYTDPGFQSSFLFFQHDEGIFIHYPVQRISVKLSQMNVPVFIRTGSLEDLRIERSLS